VISGLGFELKYHGKTPLILLTQHHISLERV
jgi:hypothetical protein